MNPVGLKLAVCDGLAVREDVKVLLGVFVLEAVVEAVVVLVFVPVTEGLAV